METAVLILILLFPTGLLLVGISNWFEAYVPERIGGYVAFVGLIFMWGPVIAGVPFILYEFIVRGIAYFLGIELPSILNE